MSLIQCPQCKREIASTCEKCSYCGYQIKTVFVDEEEENKTRYLLMGSIILLVVLCLIVIAVAMGEFKNHSRKVPKQEEIPYNQESLKIYLPNPDSLFMKAKSLYKEGKFDEADVFLTQLIDNYKNSDVISEASKLKVTVIKAIHDKWNTDQKKRDFKNQIEERKKNQELQRIYNNDPIKYYKTIYGKPDSESDFTTGSYVSKTLIWFCVAGKYHSISFVHKDGSWEKESEYTSDCN